MSINPLKMYIYKSGHPQKRIQPNPLRAAPMPVITTKQIQLTAPILQTKQALQPNSSPDYNFNESEKKKLKNKIRPRQPQSQQVTQTDVVVKQRQKPQSEDRIDDTVKKIQKAAEQVVEAHDFQKQLDGMQTLPQKHNNELFETFDQIKFTQDLATQKFVPKFASAKPAKPNSLRDDVDYDKLRQMSIKGRRSTRQNAERQQVQPVTNTFDDDDFAIPGDSVYIYKSTK